ARPDGGGPATSDHTKPPPHAAGRARSSGTLTRLGLPVAEAIHQRLLLAAVDHDHRAVDEMRQIRSEVSDEAGDLLAFGNAPQRDAARGEPICLLAWDLHV